MKTAKQKENLLKVRDIIIKKIATDYEVKHLNGYITKCGTHRCILADYMIQKMGCGEDALLRSASTRATMRTVCSQLDRMEEFGTWLSNYYTEVSVFGPEFTGSLEARLELVEEELRT